MPLSLTVEFFIGKYPKVIVTDGDEELIDNLLIYGEDILIVNKHRLQKSITIHKYGKLVFEEKIVAHHTVTGEWVFSLA